MRNLTAVFLSLGSLSLSAQVRLDLRPVEAWLSRAKEAPNRPASWEAASAATLGGQKAEASWGDFGDLPKDVPQTPKPQQVAAFVAMLKSLDAHRLEMDVAGLFPGVPAPKLPVHVVANGFPAWGDMYVRAFRFEDGRPIPTEDGEPCILVNACLAVDSYGSTAEDQARTAQDVLRHEIFHMYHQQRRKHLRLPEPPTHAARFLLTVQNEGVAHLLGTRWQFREGFPVAWFERALKELEEAVIAIRKGQADEALFQRATVGSYKFGAFAGMLFAHAIQRCEGEAGLRASLERGPADLVLRYQRLTETQVDLPKPGPETVAWARAHVDLR